MTDHLRALRVLCARTPAGDERDALEAAIKRCELPVIETCGQCPVSANIAERFGPDGEEYGSVTVCGMRDDLETVDLASEPPAWCPLRSKP